MTRSRYFACETGMLPNYLASWIFVRIACEYSVATTTLKGLGSPRRGKKKLSTVDPGYCAVSWGETSRGLVSRGEIKSRAPCSD